MAKKSNTPVVSYGKGVPQTYGTAGEVLNSSVYFGIGAINKIITSSNTSLGLIAFGYDSTLKSGAIAIGGELVSSKILDVSTDATVQNPTPSKITVKYFDTLTSTVKDFSFDVLNASNIDTALTNVNTSIKNINSSITNINSSINNIDRSIEILDTSLSNVIDTYVSTITSGSDSAIIVEEIRPLPGTTCKHYNIALNVDNETVKIENGYLKAYGNTYSIEATSQPTTGMLKTYQLYVTDASNNKSAVPNSIIDIPKDFLIKEVHICKAEYDDETDQMVEIIRQDDPDFDNTEGELYLHFIWITKDASTEAVSETFIKLTDIAPIYQGDADIVNDSTGKYMTVNSNIVTLDTSKLYDDMIEPLDVSMKNIYQQVENNELVIIEYLSYADVSINQNTLDISNLQASLEDGFVEDVSGSKVSSDLIIRNEYLPDASNASIPAVTVVNSSVTYTITKKINDNVVDVVNINTVDTKVIDKIAEILAEDAKSIADVQNSIRWITL